MSGFIVREVEERDWTRLRALRLEMLADTPIAYLETLETAQAHPVSHWQRQARGRPGGVKLVAELEDGSWVGTMTGIIAEGVPTLVAVYVAPAVRGAAAGVTDALLAGIEAWAVQHGDQLRLEVNELNGRAVEAYRRRGFVLTGRTTPYPLDPPSLELEMVKGLR
ncbi:GNAT family N-acetyltransferase [Amnibacterium kyonggiense]|uniref:Ribosomal protein S18 acetylase RimI-like enzyme n=1 Tax=Amnibacterium kyonggiense TaxID=595671 RepID=A0A4R7FT37_9MICO|nr:GNAT family N-acetyltransferase [Amnibacterium kyonggiense]TDS81020.1 ribosomal protein S18 acetylase RimI-like enzyme [Amnibacterium kyonggiense]